MHYVSTCYIQDGVPLLLDPASKGFSMVCELLLENGADPLAETKTGVSPLYAASKNGHRDVVKILVTSGACLLYTSPSPRDATLSRMPSSA